MAHIDAIVLGAGIVGTSVGLHLAKRGLAVALVDRRAPGEETSYGNAGIISSGSITSLNNPSLWKALPKYLTNRHAALRWNPRFKMRDGSHAFWPIRQRRVSGHGRPRCMG